MTAEKKYLIVNADDFGQSPGINRGVIEAHERGIVTSASLMTRWPAAAEAAAYGREHPALSLGLHVDLGEWVFREEAWRPLYEAVPLEDAAAVEAEAARQLAAFRRLVGKEPTHIDSHQHVHRGDPARAVLIETAQRLGGPLRDCTPGVHYRGDFYGQTAEGESFPAAITVAGLRKILAALPSGVTELGCHPGYGGELETMYRDEREREIRVLCHPRIRDELDALGIELVSFTSWRNRGAREKEGCAA